MDLFDIAVASKLAGGGGGGGGGDAPNMKMGNFTAQSTAGAQTITVPYDGSGYPIAICIAAESVPAISDETRGFVISYVGLANNLGTKPTYNAGYYDKMTTAHGSIITNKRYETSYSNSNQIYSQSTPARTGAADCVKIHSATTFEVNVEDSGASGFYGFRANVKYNYLVVYSE